MSSIQIFRNPRIVPVAPLPSVVEIKCPPLRADSPSVVARTLQVATPTIGGLAGVVYVLARPGALTTIVMLAAAGIAMAGTVIGSMQQSRQRRRQHALLTERYRAHLSRCEIELTRARNTQVSYQDSAFPRFAHLPDIIDQRQRVWERRPGDEDFMQVRLGSGPIALGAVARLDMRDVLDSEVEEEALRRARELAVRYTEPRVGPVGLDLGRSGVLALAGSTDSTRGLARSLICQLATTHSPEDLRVLIVCGDTATARAWEWCKWLPHLREHGRDDMGRLRLQSVTIEPVENAPQMLERILDDRLRPPDPRQRGAVADHASVPSPRFVLVLDTWRRGNELSRLAIARRILESSDRLGISVLCLTPSDSEIPASTRAMVSFTGVSGSLRWFSGAAQAITDITLEPASEADALRLARRLAPLVPADVQLTVQRRKGTVRLVDLLRIADPSSFDPRITWRAGDSAQGHLHVPLGTDTQGADAAVLDIRDAAYGGMGPNGILIGAPGAGKSELLRSLLVGLGTLHSPQRLAFVLVDFKGGSTFTALAELPHVSGLVTNLEGDPSIVLRFRDAILGELERRERVLTSAGVASISEYQALQSQHAELAPLPHLLLIVDEFAELITAFPEFDTFFETVSRLGRGLGVFALLATQGLMGGLQRLERYISYRLCLRTNNVQESMVVLGSPAAAQLPLVPGLGYLRVGSGGELRAFKAALVSAPVRDAASRVDVRRFGIGEVSDTESAAPGERTDLEVVVERIASVGAERAHSVWQKPLPRNLSLDEVLDGEFAPLSVPVGITDLPRQQRREAAVVDLAGAQGNLLVLGASRSGRSTLLATLITALVVTHSPEEVQFYCLDFGGGALADFKAVAHVGMVAGSDGTDEIRRCLATLRKLLRTRDAQFRAAGITSVTDFRTRRSNGEYSDGWGDVVLVIDNWSSAARAVDGLEDDVMALLANGLAYGVHVVVTGERQADIRTPIRDRITGRIQLRPVDPADSLFDPRMASAMPAGVPGRALVAGVFNMQVVLPRLDGVASADGIREALHRALNTEAVTGTAAPPIQILPTTLPLDYFEDSAFAGSGGPPIGLADDDLQPVHLDITARNVQHLLVYGDPGSGKTSFLRAWLAAMIKGGTPDTIRFVLCDPEQSLDDALPPEYVHTHLVSPAKLTGLIDTLREELVSRLPPDHVSAQALATRSYVAGPELVLVIDDEDTLDQQKTRLISAALSEAWSTKFHIVLARRSIVSTLDSLAGAMNSAGASAVVLSERDRSTLLSRPRPLPPGRAEILRKGAPPKLVQLIHPAMQPTPVSQ